MNTHALNRWTKRLLFGLLAAFFILWSFVVIGGIYFTVRPRVTYFPDPEVFHNYPVEPVLIRTNDGVLLSAWHIRASTSHAILLVAGIDANRNSCLGRAAFFLDRGYSALLPDLRASGKSGGRFVTLGWQERNDIRACYNFLIERGYEKIGVGGISLGAASICYALPELPEIHFIILESSYDTLVNAVRNRLAMFHSPHFIAYPFYVGLACVIGAPPWRMRPLDFVAHAMAPTLILAGDSEKEISIRETQAIYDRCGAPIKQVHFFKGAGHWDFLHRYPEEYKRVVSEFLDAAKTSGTGEQNIPENQETYLKENSPHARSAS